MVSKENKELLIYIDGKFYPKSQAKTSVFDHGLLYGDGVFEGIRAYSGIVFKLKEHIDRLYCSACSIMLEIPITKAEMTKAVINTLKKNKARTAYVRIVVTRGLGDIGIDPRKCLKPTIIIIVEPALKYISDEMKNRGITVMIVYGRRTSIDAASPEIKSLNYLNSILGKIEANNYGADEAMYLEKNGFVCEAVGENIFMIKNKILSTPPLSSGALAGITREEIMKIAKKIKFKVEEKNITPCELFNADEVFLTGTAAEIVPVREINKRQIGDGKAGPITKRLMEEFKKLTKDSKSGIKIFINK